MRFEVRRLHDEYRYTTVYVTHDQSEAMTTADVIAVMNARQDRAGRLAGGDLRPAALGVRRPLHRHEQCRARARRSTPTTSRSPACRCACTGEPLQPGADAAGVGPPARDRLSAQRARDQRTTWCRPTVVAAGLSRLEPRLYGRGRRRHAAARGDRRRPRTSRRDRRSGCTCRRNAAARWPDEAEARHPEASRAGRNDDERRRFSRRDVLKASSALGAGTLCRRAIVLAAGAAGRARSRRS